MLMKDPARNSDVIGHINHQVWIKWDVMLR